MRKLAISLYAARLIPVRLAPRVLDSREGAQALPNRVRLRKAAVAAELFKQAQVLPGQPKALQSTRRFAAMPDARQPLQDIRSANASKRVRYFVAPEASNGVRQVLG
jgi:hypothetical protein